MKVISTKPDKSVEKKAICKGCGTKIAYVPNDVKSYHGTDIGGGPDGCTWVDCPTCKDKIVLSSW